MHPSKKTPKAPLPSQPPPKSQPAQKPPKPPAPEHPASEHPEPAHSELIVPAVTPLIPPTELQLASPKPDEPGELPVETLPVAEPLLAAEIIPAPVSSADSYYGRTLREIPARKALGDRLYQIGTMYRVTAGERLDNEIELVWPEDMR